MYKLWLPEIYTMNHCDIQVLDQYSSASCNLDSNVGDCYRVGAVAKGYQCRVEGPSSRDGHSCGDSEDANFGLSCARLHQLFVVQAKVNKL